jgi:hypothetical protein
MEYKPHAGSRAKIANVAEEATFLGFRRLRTTGIHPLG